MQYMNHMETREKQENELKPTKGGFQYVALRYRQDTGRRSTIMVRDVYIFLDLYVSRCTQNLSSLVHVVCMGAIVECTRGLLVWGVGWGVCEDGHPLACIHHQSLARILPPP
jgi:hypothetical protein